jgi:hypothetical protein
VNSNSPDPHRHRSYEYTLMEGNGTARQNRCGNCVAVRHSARPCPSKKWNLTGSRKRLPYFLNINRPESAPTNCQPSF